MISGFYPGSFDPPTNGHIDVLSRAMRFLDRLVVGIGTNADKKTVFSVAERQSMLNTCLNLLLPSKLARLKLLNLKGWPLKQPKILRHRLSFAAFAMALILIMSPK